jgi:hypothetical protein
VYVRGAGANQQADLLADGQNRFVCIHPSNAEDSSEQRRKGQIRRLIL